MISGGGTLNIKYIMCVYSLASLFWANAVHGWLAAWLAALLHLIDILAKSQEPLV